MRIGFDGACLSNRRGFGRYARQILAAVAQRPSRHELVALIDRPSVDQVILPANVEPIVVDVREAPSQAASAESRRRIGDLLAMTRAVSRARLDLVFFPASYSYFPVRRGPRVVVTMHDTLPLDRPELVFPNRRGRIAWWLKETAAARRADHVVTLSEASRGDLVRGFKLPPGRIRVIPGAPAETFGARPDGTSSRAVLARHGLDPSRPFFLYVGGLSPHKNLPRLVRSFAAVASERPDIDLAIVGDLADVFHIQVQEVRDEIARQGLDHRVRLTGFVPDSDLIHLYARSMALIQPSYLEGFGLPTVEAMACGSPVLYGRAGSLPEVVGDAGIGFDPHDEAQLAQAMAAISASADLRDDLASRALRRSALFTWPRAADALLGLFDEVLAPRWRRAN
jgi:glycosyltransferase involved in cell wall biosynthesis